MIRWRIIIFVRSGEAAPITRWLFSLATLHTMLSIFIMAFHFDDQPPNQSPEPTAVGARRSAIAVHVMNRRWLSFQR